MSDETITVVEPVKKRRTPSLPQPEIGRGEQLDFDMASDGGNRHSKYVEPKAATPQVEGPADPPGKETPPSHSKAKAIYEKFAEQNLNTAALGEAIKVVRKWRGMTKRQLAEQSNLSETYISTIEGPDKPRSSSSKATENAAGTEAAKFKGRSISFETLNKIAFALQTPTTWILFMAYPDFGNASKPESGKGAKRSKQINKFIGKVKDLIEEAIRLGDTEPLSSSEDADIDGDN